MGGQNLKVLSGAADDTGNVGVKSFMRSEVKLQKYKAALADYNDKFSRGNPPIHYPLRSDFGIVRPEEIFVAERIEMKFPNPNIKK